MDAGAVQLDAGAWSWPLALLGWAKRKISDMVWPKKCAVYWKINSYDYQKFDHLFSTQARMLDWTKLENPTSQTIGIKWYVMMETLRDLPYPNPIVEGGKETNFESTFFDILYIHQATPCENFAFCPTQSVSWVELKRSSFLVPEANYEILQIVQMSDDDLPHINEWYSMDNSYHSPFAIHSCLSWAGSFQSDLTLMTCCSPIYVPFVRIILSRRGRKRLPNMKDWRK